MTSRRATLFAIVILVSLDEISERVEGFDLRELSSGSSLRIAVLPPQFHAWEINLAMTKLEGTQMCPHQYAAPNVVRQRRLKD
jgi:hypothetical protein